MTDSELAKIVNIITTHDEDDGGHCDTGEDMDWYCRSRCTELAVRRLEAAYVRGEI